MSSRGRWRWLVLLAVLVAGYAVVRVGVATTLGRRLPAIAVRIAPDNADARAALAGQALATLPILPAQLAQAHDDALVAYRREAISPVALRTLGFVADARGHGDQARLLLRLSEANSRRDLPGQIWLIEDAVRRGQVAEALHHYDVALRTSTLAPDVLFGPLTSATSDATLILPMARTLAARPAWGDFFLLRAASTSTEPTNVAKLIGVLLSRGVPVAPIATRSVLGRLVLIHDYRAAWNLYAAGHAGTRPDQVRDARFADSLAEPTMFDWSVQIDASVSAMMMNDRLGSRLTFDAAVGTGGIVARQLLLLTPGRPYRLSFKALRNDGLSADAPLWQIVCASSNREITHTVLPAAAGWVKVAGNPFTVPDGCTAQWINLVVSGSENPEGVHGSSSDVRVMPVARMIGK